MGKNYFLNTMENCKLLPQKPRKYFFKVASSSINYNWFLLVVVFASLFNSNLYAQTEIITTTGAGTWTSPIGITSFTVEVWGGGGAGGGCPATKNKGASGGTGGTYVSKTYTPTSPTTYNFLIGNQTLGTSGANGGNGNFSWFSAVGTQYATGGLGGLLGTGAAVTGSAAGSIGTTIIAGGNTLAGSSGNGSAGSSGANGGGVGGGINTPTSDGSIAGFPGLAPGGGGGGGANYNSNVSAVANAGGIGARGEIRITYLKITSLGTTIGCTGSSITINGTDFIGATASNITVGGTPVSSITSNTGTQIIAVIGAGTTGIVSITIAGKGTATSSATFTINPSPSISTQPVATSVCTFGSTTFSVAATGVITYQWRRNGINLTNAAPYSNVTTPTLTIINPVTGDAGNFDVVLNSASCPLTSNVAILTVNTVPSASITPSPTTGATGICYSGVGAITSISWAATAGATSYDIYFGTAISPVTLSANITTNAYTTGVLAANTTYYWRIVAKNGCGNATTSATWSFTTVASPCVLTYCTPTYANGPALNDQIANVTLGTLNNSSGASASPYYTFYNAASIPNLTQTLNASVSVTVGSDINQYVAVWIDFNQDGTFQTTEGMVSANAGTNGTVIITIPVPIGAILGNTRMRVRGGNDSVLTTAQACGTSSSAYGETEDYIVNIIGLPVCTTPTAQATSLVLIPSGTSIAGSFTAAAVANNYLVVINTTGVAPNPVNGTNYVAGGTIGAGNTVVDIDTDASFVATGLSLSTTYYLFVYSYNTACTGGPLYLGTSPLNGTTTTLATNYCIPTGNLNCSTNSDYIANVTINTLNNNSTCASGGYTNFAATGTQTTTLTRGNTYNLSLGTGPGNKKHGAAVWIDFNQNSVFTDVGEYFFIGNGIIANSINAIAIAIPTGATLGTTRMRVRYGRQENMVSSSACTMSGTYGETEDYTLTFIDPIVCVTPTTQATALILNSTGTTITGSFTAASTAPNNYLVVINTTGVAPTPVNTTTYVVGGTVGVGNIVVDVDSNTGFVANGLTALTTYYIFIFAYNSACSGGPIYNTTSPLNGNIATIAANYCSASVTSGNQSLGYFSEISFVGTLNDVSNYSTYSSSPLGYQDFTGLTNLSKQAQGEGINIAVQALNSSYMKAWVDWNKDGDFLDTGELVYDTGGISTYSTTFGFIIPSAQALGNYRIRIRCNSRDFSLPYDSASTDVFSSCGIVDYGGETEDYLFTVVASCNSLITSVTDGRTCGTGSVNLVASSTSVGVIQYRWYSTPTGSTLIGTTSTGSWTTPLISSNTTYYVTSYNGCESIVRTAIHAIVSPIPTLTYYPTNPIVCGEDTGVELSATGDVEEVFLIDEKFISGLGTFTNTNILSTAENANSQWQNHTSTFVLTPITNYNVWFPAISTGVNGNGFAMSTSDVGGVTIHNQMASATLNSTSFTSLTLSMRLFYSRYYIDGASLGLDYVTIDVSTNGGTAWTEIKRYTEDIGIGTRFESVSFDLSSYINQTNLKVRIRYYGEWCDGLAVDDIKLYGNRPSTDLNWTTAIPAFTDAACTIAYDSNFTASTIYVKPSLAQLEFGSFSFLATAVLSNGCSTSQTITITNTSKIWQGGTNWQTAANWKPVGVPDATNCVIIPSTAIIPGSSYQAYAKNLTIKPTGNLEILSTSNLTVTDFVNINTLGVFTIRNNGSLVQINDAATNVITGTFNMDRTTTMRKTDYVYWSSPVAGFNASAISSGTNPYYIWKWNPSIANTNGGFGNWVSGNETMSVGKGYIVRGPDIFTSTAVPFTATFSGVLHNGIKQPSITRGTYTGTNYLGTNGTTITSNDDNWNLVGNPFPSAIDAKEFLDLNTNLAGNVRLWTHGTNIALGGSTFYGSYSYNYSTSDYVNFNGTGSTPPGFNGKIGAAQGFFVLMNEATAVTESVTFNNSLRTDTLGNAYNNSQFYRTNNSNSTVDNSTSKNLIWLSLLNSTNVPTTTLIGYVEGATYEQDRLFDAPHKVGSTTSIYSMIIDKSMIIQGRPNPFNSNDLVPIGVTISNSGIYNIAISEVDGLFENTNQNIYLEDTFLGIIHDLRTSPYSFNGITGTVTNRFILRYTNNTLLGVDTTLENQTLAFINNHQLQVQSIENIKQILLYDISGKLVHTYQPSEMKNRFYADFFYGNGAYIVKITLENGSIVSNKLLN